MFVIEKNITVYFDKLQSEKKELACDWKLYNAALFTLIRVSLNSSQFKSQIFINTKTFIFDDNGRLISTFKRESNCSSESAIQSKGTSQASVNSLQSYLMTVLFHELNNQEHTSEKSTSKFSIIENDPNFKATRQICESVGGQLFCL